MSNPVMERTCRKFQEAAKSVGGIKSMDNQTKLKLYGLFKQVTVGKNNTPKPGLFDYVGLSKWDAWNALGTLSKKEAEKQYISIVEKFLGSLNVGGDSSGEETDGLVIKTENGVKTIQFNRPEKKNAFSKEMFQTITKTLRDCNEDDSVSIVVLTGTGDYFSSGNDLENFIKEVATTDPKTVAGIWKKILQDHFGAYIDLKKPLVAVVNGPAIGVGVTQLGHCDAIFASDKAAFTTPFTSSGITPEACSSHLFPLIMGYARANELLLFNQTFSAKEAQESGLVTKVFAHDQLETEAWKRINEMAELPTKSLIHSKELVRGKDRKLLHEVNKTECERMEERVLSEDCANAVQKFFAQRQTSKK